jgi:histidinol-phosphate phosphatase family protein
VNSAAATAKCVFFDRDGVVNRAPVERYVTRVEEFHLLPEFVAALRVVHAKGYVAVVVTNQAGIERGSMTQAAVDEIHDTLVRQLATERLSLLDIYVCPFLDDAHPHRKPNPGMLLEAAKKHGLDLAASWMVGDNEKDITAGRGAGCRTVLVRPGRADSRADFRLQTMAELPGFLRKHLA